jgi:hypothetical protein
MTLPLSIPQHRHVPPSERFVRGTRSTQLIKKDEHSQKRNAEQIVFQASGEIGKYYYGIESKATRLMYQPLVKNLYQPSSSTQYLTASQTSSSSASLRSARESTQSVASPEQSSARLSNFSARDVCTDNTPHKACSPVVVGAGTHTRTSQGPGPGKERVLQTLGMLDRSFKASDRNDLRAAATAGARGNKSQEAVWSATGSFHEHMHAKPWILKLRGDDPSPQAARTVGGGNPAD